MKNKHTKPTAELKAQATDWAKLDAMSDAEIDYSDIPKLDDEFVKNAVRNPFYRPVKAATTVRLDTHQGRHRVPEQVTAAMLANACLVHILSQ